MMLREIISCRYESTRGFSARPRVFGAKTTIFRDHIGVIFAVQQQFHGLNLCSGFVLILHKYTFIHMT
jgi:hypothetical protein